MKNNDKLAFPKSFPNEGEELFLDLLFCTKEEFPYLWARWKKETVFDDINYATFRLVSLLCLRLKEFGFSNDELYGRIKGVYRKTWLKNQLLIDATERVVSLMKKNDIPVAVFKGIPLLIQVYKDVGARFLSDADIIIDPEHIRKAFKLLTQHGWKYTSLPFPVLEKDPTEACLAIDREITVREDKENGVEVDVHWKLFDRPNNPMVYEEIVSRAQPIAINGVECLAFSPEDLLLHVIVHGSVYSEYRPIRWIVDAGYIIREMRLDWDLLLSLIKKYKFEVQAVIAFRYLSERRGMKIPEGFMKKLKDIPLDPKELRTYYRLSNKPSMAPLGTLPLIWKVYWRFEAEGKTLRNAYLFFPYVGKAYHIKSFPQFAKFVFEKCKKRINIFG